MGITRAAGRVPWIERPDSICLGLQSALVLTSCMTLHKLCTLSESPLVICN